MIERRWPSLAHRRTVAFDEFAANKGSQPSGAF
jgi:hypothetical protein